MTFFNWFFNLLKSSASKKLEPPKEIASSLTNFTATKIELEELLGHKNIQCLKCGYNNFVAKALSRAGGVEAYLLYCFCGQMNTCSNKPAFSQSISLRDGLLFSYFKSINKTTLFESSANAVRTNIICQQPGYLSFSKFHKFMNFQ